MLYKRPTLVGNIKRLLFGPCATEPSVWVELTLDAIIRFGVTVIEPDPKEVYHHVVGEPLVHSIRQTARDIGHATGSEETPVRRALGTVLGVEDRLVWWYFLLSVGKDALVDSSSLAIRMNPCPGERGLGSGVAYISAIEYGMWQTANFSFQGHSPYAPVHDTELILWHGNHWTATIAASTKWHDFNNIPVGVESRIIFVPANGDEPTIVDHFSNTLPNGEPTQAKNHVFAKYTDPHGRDGNLRCEFKYSGEHPPLNEVFLDRSSTCYMVG